jgi:cytidine deaminase
LSYSEQELIEAAITASEAAFAPFSNFRVGAVVETDDGKLFKGCNIESSSYGLTVCAERVAIWKALSEGYKSFKSVVVVADTESLTPPCGACRQIIWEFCRDASVIFANLSGKSEKFKASDLLPHAFDARFLKQTGAADAQ